MDWTLILFFILILSMFVVIGLLFVSLAKQGDERKEFIKAKTMINTFVLVVGLLIFFVFESLYVIFVKEMKPEGINPFTLLVTISVIFLIILLYNKKKFGD